MEGIHIRAVKAKGVGGDLSAPRTAPSPTTHQLFTCRMVSPVSWASCFFCSSEGYGCCSHQQESFGLPHCCPSLRSSLGASGPRGRRRVGQPLPPWPRRPSPAKSWAIYFLSRPLKATRGNWTGGDSQAGVASSPTQPVPLKESLRVLPHPLPISQHIAQLYFPPLVFLL